MRCLEGRVVMVAGMGVGEGGWWLSAAKCVMQGYVKIE